MTDVDKPNRPDSSGSNTQPDRQAEHPGRNERDRQPAAGDSEVKISETVQIPEVSEPKPAEPVVKITGHTRQRAGVVHTISTFYEDHKAPVNLAVLVIYVITLAIATIIELIEH